MLITLRLERGVSLSRVTIDQPRSALGARSVGMADESVLGVALLLASLLVLGAGDGLVVAALLSVLVALLGAVVVEGMVEGVVVEGVAAGSAAIDELGGLLVVAGSVEFVWA